MKSMKEFREVLIKELESLGFKEYDIVGWYRRGRTYVRFKFDAGLEDCAIHLAYYKEDDKTLLIEEDIRHRWKDFYVKHELFVRRTSKFKTLRYYDGSYGYLSREHVCYSYKSMIKLLKSLLSRTEIEGIKVS